jgi:hypothetical protein
MNINSHLSKFSSTTVAMCYGRRGISSIEALVGFTILSTAITLSLPLVVHHQRLLESARHYRLALDELSNQLDRFVAVPSSDLASEIKELKPSSFIISELPGAQLTGELKQADIGQRLTLHLTWTDMPRRPTSISLASWILPSRDARNPIDGGSAP